MRSPRDMVEEDVPVRSRHKPASRVRKEPLMPPLCYGFRRSFKARKPKSTDADVLKPLMDGARELWWLEN